MSAPGVPAPAPAPAPATATARIADRGYRRYTGERGGVGASMRSVVKYTTQRVLGIHRKFRFKVMPILTIVISYVPHMVFVGVVVLTNQLERESQVAGADVPDGAGRMVANQLIQDYPGSYTTIVLAIVLFAAFVAPEVLCTDRRTGMLGLYMASPLNRGTYLAAKGAAVMSIMLTVTLGPSLLLLIGYSTQGYGPSGFVDWISTVLRVLVVGGGIGLFHTMVSCAISSITTRRAAASAAFVVLLMGTGALSAFLIEEADAPLWVGAFDLFRLPSEFAFRAFGQVSTVGYSQQVPVPDASIVPEANATWEYVTVTPTWIVYAGFVGWIALSAVVIWDRYRRVEVTK